MGENMTKTFIVDANGAGDFSTIQEVLALPEEKLTIILKPGIYSGQIFSTKKYLCIKGENPETTVITGSIGAKQPFSDGNITGTFRTYTAYFSGQAVHLENLTIENTAGQGSIAGQAIALYASASFVYCKNLILSGFQDTLFTGPLPEKEKIPGGFRGPEENLPRRKSIQYYENCHISGTVDYIFGSADVLFKNCTLSVHDTQTECYITAPSTPSNGTGYIFDSCKIQKAEDYNIQQHKNVYLGRPWRKYAKCCWINCDFGEIICQQAWDNWNDAENEKTSCFSAFNNKWLHSEEAGKGKFGKVLTSQQADEILKISETIRQSVLNSCSKEA